jgi:DNA-binding SARP family transcriptional activator/Flp pilus assembly protein TadD
MFVVQVLGGLALTSTIRPVPTGALQRRRMSLLALLALAREPGMSRERIQAYLWPESDTSRARHALEQLLYATRRDFGSDAVASSATELRLNPDVVRADVWDFDDAVRDEQWAIAVGLYGGPLLSGQHLADSTELERWIEGERVQREQAYLRALGALARAAWQRGDAADAVRWHRLQAAADPLSVPVVLDLMRALEAAGDRVAAVQQARVYQQLVVATLEVEPDPAVQSLANAISARTRRAPNVAAVAELGVSAPFDDGSPPSVADSPMKPVTMPTRRTGAPAGVWKGVGLLVALGGVAVMLAVRGRSLESGSAAGGSGPGQTLAPTTAKSARSPTTRPADSEARALYLRGRTLWEKRTKEPLDEAIVLFRQATERDPSYAQAWAGLAQSYALLGYFGFAPADAMFPKARAAALRAIALDSTPGEAYAALGQALAWQHSWADAEAAYQRAVKLEPQDATAHQWYALLLAYLGRAREAAMHTGQASQLDPLSVQVNNMHGMMLYYAGDTAGALRQYERTVDAEPDSAWVRQNPWVLTNFSRVAAAAGRKALAVRLVERALEVVPSHPRPWFDLAYAYVAAGEPNIARAAFARADTAHPHYAVYRALLHGILGEYDQAFAWFDRLHEWPLPSLVSLNCEPRLAALRADPRFKTIRQRLNMPPN